MNANSIFKSITAVALIGLPMLTSAQDYDDDIYYNPSKSKTTKTTQTTPSTTTTQRYVSQKDYAAAGTYYYNTGSTRDVDEYNRRGAYAIDTTSVANDSTAVDEFGYTRRIERFHNPDVVVNSGDSDLIDYYYSTDASSANGTSTINVYVYDDPYYYSAWRYPYYRYGRWGFYDPWYWDVWGPSWSFSWGFYDPWFSLSWGWGPSWGWGYTWGHHHHCWGGDFGWGGGHGWGGGNIHPGGQGGRGHFANVGSSMNNVRRASAGSGFTSSRRQGSALSNRFGSSSNGRGNVGSTTTSRGRYGYNNNSSSNSSSRRSSSSYNGNSESRNSYNSYNSNSSSSSRGSGSSWGGSSRGGGSSYGGGGGSHGGGGGGGGRGRR